MPCGQIEGGEMFVDKQGRKTVSLKFCGLILKYWLWQQLYPLESYYYMHSSGSAKLEFIVLFY
jgi:hypothetical protein